MTEARGPDIAAPERLRVGVLGLGRMGLPVALRLRAAGHDVMGYDLDPLRRAQFRESPDPRVPDRAETNGEARFGTSGGPRGWEPDVLVSVLPGPAELTFAMVGDASPEEAGAPGRDGACADGACVTGAGVDGALATLRAGALWVDLTSGDPRVARALASVAAARGVHAVGAPMAGGPADAGAGTLGFFVGGAAEAVERALPLLRLLGDPDRLERAGDEVGAGHVAKLLANTLWFGQVAAVVEVLLIGRAQGIAPEQLAGILRRSAGGGAFLDRHLDALFDGDYLETFGIDRVVEELDTVVNLAADADLPVALTGLVARLHHEALERFGPVDGELLVARLLEERAGTRIRRSHP